MTLRNIIPSGKKSVPVRRNSNSPFSLLRREMDDLFNNFFNGFEMEPFFGRHDGVFSPTVDITENNREIRVSAELPGMDDRDIDVTLGKESLTIKGEKKEEKEDKAKDYYYMERSYGSFSRTIPIPVEVNTDRAAARFKKGVLTVTIPKTKKAIEEKKKITVKAD
jgi:HSP20 family protein